MTAVGHSILTAAWHMLHNGELYNDLGADYFIRQNPDRITKRLVRQLESLGHRVTLEPQSQTRSSPRTSPPDGGISLQAMGRRSVKTVDVRADGTGLSSRTGTSLLALVTDRLGLTGGLCDA